MKKLYITCNKNSAFWFKIALSAVTVLILSCANQMHPSGGPVDKTPPSVSVCTPAPGSVSVSGKLNVTCVFSEWIDPRLASRSVSVFPPPEKGVKVTVKGKTLRIVSKSDLTDSTTYHVEINATMQDLNGISIGRPFHFVFATGPVLDSGSVSGCVSSTGGLKNRQPKIALFRHDSSGLADSMFFKTPSYATQTDSMGFFSLQNIRRGRYDIIAFADDDNNNRLSSAMEQCFAPVNKSFLLDDSAGPFVMYPVLADSARKHIVSLVALDSATVLGEWDPATRRDDSLSARLLPKIEPFEKNDTVLSLTITDYIYAPGPLRFFLRLGRNMKPVRYRLVYRPQPQTGTSASDTIYDTLLLNGFTARDTVVPSVRSFEPGGTVSLSPRVSIVWNRPMQALRTSFLIADTAGNSVECSCDTVFSDTTIFMLSEKLQPGRSYKLEFPDSSFTDVCGNIWIDTSRHADSADTSGFTMRFNTVSEENLCFSLSGSSTCLDADDTRIWKFMPFGVKAAWECRDIGAAFRFDSIPAAKGLLGYFIDADGNGINTPGRLLPWKSPEVSVILPDTIEARARWDVEGLSVEGCDICPKPEEKKKNTAEEGIKSSE
jgi:hypothetical protein